MNILEFVAQENASISSYPAIIYARIENVEVGAKPRDFGGDREAAAQCAVDQAMAMWAFVPKPASRSIISPRSGHDINAVEAKQ